ncbi:MAG: septum formation initiator family protein [Kiritimatiellae bacterium]|nr:septum formation initiator family protein [Kiritimatiellia bacterium]
MGKLWDKLCQLCFTGAFVAVIVTGGVMSYPKYRQAQGLSAERDQIRRRIEEKTREIAAIRDKQRRFTTDREFVEALARENRRVFPNELVFVFED